MNNQMSDTGLGEPLVLIILYQIKDTQYLYLSKSMCFSHAKLKASTQGFDEKPFKM